MEMRRAQPANGSHNKEYKFQSGCHGHCHFGKTLSREVICIFKHLYGCSRGYEWKLENKLGSYYSSPGKKG